MFHSLIHCIPFVLIASASSLLIFRRPLSSPPDLHWTVWAYNFHLTLVPSPLVTSFPNSRCAFNPFLQVLQPVLNPGWHPVWEWEKSPSIPLVPNCCTILMFTVPSSFLLTDSGWVQFWSIQIYSWCVFILPQELCRQRAVLFPILLC